METRETGCRTRACLNRQSRDEDHAPLGAIERESSRFTDMILRPVRGRHSREVGSEYGTGLEYSQGTTALMVRGPDQLAEGGLISAGNVADLHVK